MQYVILVYCAVIDKKSNLFYQQYNPENRAGFVKANADELIVFLNRVVLTYVLMHKKLFLDSF